MSFLRSVFSVSALTIISRITGYMRDLLVAHYIGATAISDALNLMIKIPAFFRRIFAEGAFSVSFLPAYTHTHKSKHFAGMVLSLLIGTLALLVLGVEWYHGALADRILHHYPQETLTYVKQFGPIIFPYIFFISIASFFSSILNAYGRFFATSLASTLGNMTIIAFVSIFYRWTHQVGILFSWGILFSGIIQCIFLCAMCWFQGHIITPQWPQWNQDIRHFLRKFWSGMCSISVPQINILIMPMIWGAFLPVGSLSYLQYADRLIQLPLSIIGIALSSVLLPMISEKIKAQDQQGADAMLSQALQMAWVITLPALVMLIGCAFPLISLLFGGGKLTGDQLHIIAETVTVYAFGVPAYIFIKILNSRFFADKDMRTPLIGGAIGMIMDIVLAILCVGYFQHLGIALAACVSAWCTVSYLFYQLIRGNLWSLEPRLRLIGLQSSLVALVSGALVLMARLGLGPIDQTSIRHKIFYVGILLTVCAISFMVGLWKTGIVSKTFFKNIRQ